MSDDDVINLDDKRDKAERLRTQFGSPKRPEAEIRSAIRALQPGDSLFGKPPLSLEGGAPYGMLPPYCPVKPLGRDGSVFYFIDASGSLAELTPSASGKGHIDALFAGAWPYLIWAWGRVKHVGKGAKIPLENYDAEKVRSALFEAATSKGAWNAIDMVRGRGAWIGAKNELVLHLGSHLLIDGKEIAPCGERDGLLYPQQPRLAAPEDMPQPAGPDGCGQQILDRLESWNWSRGGLDARLMLGWVAMANVGGALDWRPSVFVTGDKATGKSTLQKLIGVLLGGGTVNAVETTGAGIYQALKHDCLPVCVDELEASLNGHQARRVIELARVSSSGGRMLRGGQDHQGKQFTLRSPFMFSGINAPALQSQDRSRMVLMSLRALDPGNRSEPIDFLKMGELGRQLARRVLDWWPRLQDLRNRVHDWLIEVAGHDSRAADTFGTLVAFCHVALCDGDISDADLERWCEELSASTLAELETQTDNWKLCLRHMLQVRSDNLRTETYKSVGAILQRFKVGDDNENVPADARWVKKKLELVGLGLVGPKIGTVTFENAWLFVPNDHSALTPLFDGTKWQSEPGSPGGWSDGLRQSPEFRHSANTGVHEKGVGRVGETPLRGTKLRLASLFELIGDPEDGEGNEE